MMKRAPELRFPEFTDEWKQTTVGQVFDFYTTNSYSRSNLNDKGGEVKNIHYGDIHMRFPTIVDVKDNLIPYLSQDIDLTKISQENYCKDGDVIIADASEDYADIGKAIELKNIGNDKVVAGLHTLLARDNKDITVNGYKGYMFLGGSVRKQIKVLAVGTKVLGISKANINQVKLNIPNKEEQKKLAQLFLLIDRKIEAQKSKVEALEEYKKGMIQRIFSQEIRFKDSKYRAYPNWKIKKLSKYIVEYTDITQENNQYPALTSSRKGLFLQKDYFNRQIASDDNTGYNIVPRGYFTYRHMSDDTIFYFNINEIVDYGIVSTLYPVFTTTEELDSQFLKYYLNESPDFRKYALLQKQGGSRTYMYLSKLKQFEIKLPCIEEQRKIAQTLNLLQKKLDRENGKLTLLKDWKRGLLQKMLI